MAVIYRSLTPILIATLLIFPTFSKEWMEDDYSNELSDNTDRRFWKILEKMAHLEQDSQKQDYEDEDSASEEFSQESNEDDYEDNALSFVDRSIIDESDREGRRQRLKACEVVKKMVKLDRPGYIYKPDYYVNLTCKETHENPIEYAGPQEFCYLVHPYRQQTCETEKTQIYIFSRASNSSRWTHHTQVVGIGCGCAMGFKYYY